MGRPLPTLDVDNEAEERLGAARHLWPYASTDAMQLWLGREAIEIAFIEAVIRDLLAFAGACGRPDIRRDAEAARRALALERTRAVSHAAPH